MSEKRKDLKGRNLKEGEDQMPDGRYRFRYTDRRGKRQAVYSWRLLSSDKTPAGRREGMSLREKENCIKQDLAEGIDGRSAARYTLNDMFKLYMDGKHELKQSTRSTYNYVYRNYVAESLGNERLSDIKYSDIKTFYNMLIRNRGLKPNSMEIINAILHPVFTVAVRDGYIRSNPTAGVILELKKGHNWEKQKRHAMTEEEQERFVAFVANSELYGRWLPLLTVLLGTGCRIGEVLGLRWCDCDFENGTISINHNLIYRQKDGGGYEMHISTPKTAAGCRMIPMLKEVREALLHLKERQLKTGHVAVAVDGYSGFVFTNSKGNIHIPRTVNRAFESMRRECNKEERERAKLEGREPLEIRHFSAHNLRHTFCTRFCENETNIKVIQEIMGHSDIGTTMNIYAEATESKKKESFINLEGKIKIS